MKYPMLNVINMIKLQKYIAIIMNKQIRCKNNLSKYKYILQILQINQYFSIIIQF